MSDDRLLRLRRDFGQSTWIDFISRDALHSGELARLVRDGVLGLTSNPTIFEKAISTGKSYDADIAALASAGRPVNEIYEALALADIAAAADLLRPVYDRTDGEDGYVSLEVSPYLAHDTVGTIAEAKRLFAALARPNVMIKIPGTPEGIPAIAEAIGSGININVTLLFALNAYEAAAGRLLRWSGGVRRVKAAMCTGWPPSPASSSAASTRWLTSNSRAIRARPICRAAPPSPTPDWPTPASSEIFAGTALGGAGRRRARVFSGLCGPAPAPRTRAIPTPSTWTR